jgi:xylan 1,4-beta-xylosidase
VETQDARWILAHLASRPIGFERRCVLGRETCLQEVKWSADGWLRLAHGGHAPAMDSAGPSAPPAQLDHFEKNTLDLSWSSLRVPVDASWLSLSARSGWLRLKGRDSLHSLHEQSLVAKRLQHFRVAVTTRLDFEPDHFTQAAGLVCYYHTGMHYYLRVTHDEELGKVLGIALTDKGNYDELCRSQLAIDGWPDLHLRASIDRERLQFSASPDGSSWQDIGPVLDATKLSDDYSAGFTGAMIGLCAQDLGGTGRHADFDFFELSPLP